jgi:hypothetical protein
VGTEGAEDLVVIGFTPLVSGPGLVPAGADAAVQASLVQTILRATVWGGILLGG